MREGLEEEACDFEAEVEGGRVCGDGLLLDPALFVFETGGGWGAWGGEGLTLTSGGLLGGGARGGPPREAFSVSLGGADTLARGMTGTLSFIVSCGSPVKPLLSRAWVNMYSVTGPTTSSSSEICRVYDGEWHTLNTVKGERAYNC